MQRSLEIITTGQRLTEGQSTDLFRAILRGELTTAQIVGVLSAIAARGETVDELVGAARAMRENVTRVPTDPRWAGALVDTCGTGGAPKTFNISTAAAIIAVGAGSLGGSRAGVRIAKHGNRSRTGRGSAEVLGALGVNVDASPEVQARCLGEAGVCFCFAIHHHPAMRHGAEARKALNHPTIFNLLGPLTNPAGASRQVLGVFARDKVELVAGALARLGADRAMVVHGLDTLDEMTTTAPTLIAHVERGAVRTETIDAIDFGIPRASLAELTASSVDDSARIIREILAGVPSPPADIAIWNAAGALVVGGAAEDLRGAIALAREAIASGSARQTLELLVRSSRG